MALRIMWVSSLPVTLVMVHYQYVFTVRSMFIMEKSVLKVRYSLEVQYGYWLE